MWRSHWKTALAAGVLFFVLISAMLVNGFPFIFNDTAYYIDKNPFNSFHSAFYGLFLNGALALGLGLVGIALLQALMVWALLLVLMRVMDVCNPRSIGLLSIGIFLSSLPMTATFLMPDIFFPLGGIALGLLMLNDERIQHIRGARPLLMAIVVASSCMHPIAWAIYAMVAVGIWVWQRKRSVLVWRWPLLSGILSFMMIGGEVVYREKVSGFNSGLHAYVVARFVEEGIWQNHQASICREHPSIQLCRVQLDDRFRTPDRFLWGWGEYSPISMYDRGDKDRFSEFIHSKNDFNDIIVGVLQREHVKLLIPVISRTLFLFRSYPLGMEMVRLRVLDDPHVLPLFEKRIPGISLSIQSTPQNSIQRDTGRLNVLNAYASTITWTSWIWMLLHVVFIFAMSRHRRFRVMAVYWGGLILVNNVLCASLSNPYAVRYFSRMSWLSVLVVVLGVEIWMRRRHETKVIP